MSRLGTAVGCGVLRLWWLVVLCAPAVLPAPAAGAAPGTDASKASSKPAAAAAAKAAAKSAPKAAAKAGAGASCPRQQTTQAFATWGDAAAYALVVGGAFESLTWSVTGTAALAPENEPFGIAGGGVSSVRLASGDSVTSPVLCLSRDHPHLRFLARATEPRSRLRLVVSYDEGKGRAHTVTLTDQLGDRYAAWAPSPDVDLKKVLPAEGAVRNVRLRFSVGGTQPGSWLVDAVFVDPVMRG
jgi:hypothetical protein